jgi:hypothetical protein
MLATVWDGLTFRQIPPDEAERLEAEDKCQNLSRRFVSGTELKYRHQFAGYATRELRAAPVPVAVAVVTNPESPSDWKAHREAAAAYLMKPLNKTTKADTIHYLEKDLGSAAA